MPSNGLFHAEDGLPKATTPSDRRISFELMWQLGFSLFVGESIEVGRFSFPCLLHWSFEEVHGKPLFLKVRRIFPDLPTESSFFKSLHISLCSVEALQRPWLLQQQIFVQLGSKLHTVLFWLWSGKLLTAFVGWGADGHQGRVAVLGVSAATQFCRASTNPGRNQGVAALDNPGCSKFLSLGKGPY